MYTKKQLSLQMVTTLHVGVLGHERTWAALDQQEEKGSGSLHRSMDIAKAFILRKYWLGQRERYGNRIKQQ